MTLEEQLTKLGHLFADSHDMTETLVLHHGCRQRINLAFDSVKNAVADRYGSTMAHHLATAFSERPNVTKSLTKKDG